MDKRSDPKSFSLQVWEKLTKCAYDPGKYFLPATSLDEVVQRETVEHMLKGLYSDSHGEHSRSEGMQAHNNAFPADSVASLMQYVFGARSAEHQPSRKPARKILAILALMDKVTSLIDFMNAGIYDEHLPLMRDNEEGATFDLVRMIDGKKTSPTCFKGWPQKDIRDFDNYQWYMVPPSFMMRDEQAAFYEIEDRAIFPWLVYSPPISAPAGSVVRKNGASNPWFALKELQRRPQFDSEVAALRKLRPNRHLVTLLASYEYQSLYYLLFEWATGGSLLDLWNTHHPSVPDRSWVLWFAEQCLGLADGLHGIHNTQPRTSLTASNAGDGTEDKNCGRHGDIKCANVLWFKQEPGAHGHGVLKIADFGLSRFHSQQTTKVPAQGVAVSLTFKAPELETMDEISRPFDIWSLGCLYLDFITWLVQGWDGVDAFSLKRAGEKDSLPYLGQDKFYNLWRPGGPGSPSATVKQAVKEVS
ncbi:protein kinase domain-containing protein [Metarhizium robertsii ARSEF 23]|uniref:Protein kinase domain-containing protein n=1 Tax=Metarhizium robertsii (strain ARSEF 23 / ATCC MYA-3075) TaxID=655844 RepID=E9FAC5_METRA|nr:protein kinase domain-containing protein [Metarhizium robertsii ARSEF 23]EFY95275.2 protein kinase domain-containing protein [Metarhizium robertsii ARSEF 23]